MPIIQACYCCCTSVRQLAYAAGIYSMIVSFSSVFLYLLFEIVDLDIDSEPGKLSIDTSTEQNEVHPQQYLTSGKDRFINDQNVNHDIYISNKSDIQTDKTNHEKEPYSYMGLDRNDVYWQKQIGFVCDVMVLCGCIPLFYGLTTHKRYWLLPWIGSKACHTLSELATAISILCLKKAKFEPVTAFMFTGYFFLFFLNIYAVLAVTSQYQEYSSMPLIIEFELGQVSNRKSDQTQLCVTSSGEGKGTLKLNKREESSYVEWSCNEHANQDSNNSSQSTVTIGTNKSSNGNATKLPEAKNNSKPKKISFFSKLNAKQKERNKMENDYEGIGTKLLPKLVVTHVSDKKGSSALEDHEMNSVEGHVEESKKVTGKCRSIIGPNKGSKYVITKLNGSIGKDVESPGYSHNRPKLGFKSLGPSRTNSMPKSKKSKHVKDALRKHGKQKHKLDAIEEASVELMSSSVAVTYNFGMEKDDEDICDKETSNMTEMHTIDEVNGVTHERPCESSSTNSGNETATSSNSSEGASDSLENVFQQYRSASLPVPTKHNVVAINISTDENHRKTSSCGKIPSKCMNGSINETYIDHASTTLKTPIMSEGFNGKTSLILNEERI